MLLTIELRRYIIGIIVYIFLFFKSISCQGVACYKCMTTNPQSDMCQDPFSSLLNSIQVNCQATSFGKNGTFPARFCVKISGRVTSVDEGGNMSYLNTVIYFRSCVVDNIMESTKSLETSGNFRLKGFQSMPGSIRLQGFMSLCTADGCNYGRKLVPSISLTIGFVLLLNLCKLSSHSF